MPIISERDKIDTERHEKAQKIAENLYEAMPPSERVWYVAHYYWGMDDLRYGSFAGLVCKACDRFDQEHDPDCPKVLLGSL